MMKKTKLLGIILGTMVIATAALGAVSTRLTTVSFGVWGETEPWYTLTGFYDKSITVYSGQGYYLQIDHENGAFSGWFATIDGQRYDASGVFCIEGNRITGSWSVAGVSGWISGKIGV